MDTKALPTTIEAVEAYLRSLLPPDVAANLSSVYPFLFGMATVKLAESNAEIARLTAYVSELEAEQDGTSAMPTHDLTAQEYNCWNCGELARRDHPHACEVTR